MPSVTAVDASYSFSHDHALIAASSNFAANAYLNVLDELNGLSGSSDLSLSSAYVVSSTNGLLANDSTTGDGTLNVSAINGVANQPFTLPSGSMVAVASDGSLLFVPGPGLVSTDTFTYTASDGTDSASATVTINVTDIAPVASDATVSAVHDQLLQNINLTQNATDADGDPLTASIVSGPSNGQLMQNPDGTFDYLPNSQFVGADSFTYKTNDGVYDSNTSTVAVNVTDQAPVANAVTYGVHADSSITVGSAIGVLANAADADGDALTANLVSTTSNGALNFNNDGSFTYTPVVAYTGTDSFTYKATDGILASVPTTVTLSVHNDNQTPSAMDDDYTVAHNTTLTVPASGVLANDTDPDSDPLTAVLVNSPDHGTVTLNSDGSFTYTPNFDFIGLDAFTYVANDGVANSNLVAAFITVTDNAPSAGDWSFTVMHDHTLTVSSTVLSESTDADGDPLTAVKVSDPTDGNLTLNPDGTFTYVPNAHFAGTDSFSYEANDGMENSDPAVVYIYVIDNAPIAGPAYYSTPENQTLTVPASGVLANASDPDGDAMTAQLVSPAANGTVTLNGDGSFVYVPNSGFIGNDTFVYAATDGIMTSNAATVTITVNDENGTPVANDDQYGVAMNQVLTVSAGQVVMENDTNPENLPLTVALVSQASNGTVSLNDDGSFTYTPNTGASGTDSFTYDLVSSGDLVSNTATVQVAVIGVGLPAQPLWVPVNANDDNGSQWQANSNNLIPQERDFNYMQRLPQGRTDPQLLPIAVTLNGVQPQSLVAFNIAESGTGDVRLWFDNQKAQRLIAGFFYPANTIPGTIYVEGLSATSRTIIITNGQPGVVSQPNTDITITMTYVAPSVNITSQPLNVGVGPVVNIFSINYGPNPPYQIPPGAVTAPTVGFFNGVDFQNGYFSGTVNGIGAQITPGAIFSGQAYNPVGGALQFIQNETITNGGGLLPLPASFAYFNGRQPQNWVFANPQTGQQIAGPLLDVPGNVWNPNANNPVVNPPTPFYTQFGLPIQGANNVQSIAALDSPNANGPTLVRVGLRANGNNILSAVSFTFNFIMSLVWQMPPGNGGPLGGAGVDNSIYTLAIRPWSLTFTARSNAVNGWPNTILAGSGISSPGDFVISHQDPVVVGPIANDAAKIQ